MHGGGETWGIRGKLPSEGSYAKAEKQSKAKPKGQSKAKLTLRERDMHSWPCSCGVDARHYNLHKLASGQHCPPFMTG